jgi:hypothetical protein
VSGEGGVEREEKEEVKEWMEMIMVKELRDE